MINVIKKNGEHQKFNGDKIRKAIRKSAARVCVTLTDKEEKSVVDEVRNQLRYQETDISVETIHNMVEVALDHINPNVAKSYREYRDNRRAFGEMLDRVYSKKLSLNFVGDRSNANADSALVTTQKAIVYNELNSELYKKFFLTQKEARAVGDGYLYIHDRGSRLDTMNCFGSETKFVTEFGLRRFSDFQDGDTVKVLTHLGNWKNAVVHSYGNQSLDIVRFKRGSNSFRNVVCTRNHRWILKDGSDTTTLNVGDRLFQTPDTTDMDWSSLNELEKKWWVYGFCMGDGHTECQCKNSWYSYIRLFGGKCRFAERFKDAGFTVTQPRLGVDGALSVYIPKFRKDAFCVKDVPFDCIPSFVNGWLSADGHLQQRKSGRCTFRGIQVTGRFNDFIEDLLTVAGYFTSKKTDLTDQVTNYGRRRGKTISYSLYTPKSRAGWLVDSIERGVRVETVWCLEVEDDHSFILEGGIPSGNCCVFDMKNVITGGFFMGNLDYVEPKSLAVAFDLIGDVTLNAASSQYGGFTIPQIDKLLAPYAERSYQKYVEEYMDMAKENGVVDNGDLAEKADMYAEGKVMRDFEQGFQSWEMKFNSVASSRGDYPFTSVTFGIGTGRWETMCSSAAMRVRRNGQGKPGFRHPVLFPKLSFFYDEELHGEGKPLEWLFDEAIECSAHTMYPDFISLTGDGYAPRMYRKYGLAISRMGCRAQVSPWYERGGMEPADEDDRPVFDGRFNMGAISLHFSMMVAKAKKEDKDFFDVLTYYLEMARAIHRRTVEFLSHKKAGTNPLGYCQGGFYGGSKKPDEELGADFLKPMTISFGIIGLNEASVLATGKPIHEDNSWAVSVLKFINEYVDRIKKEDGILYAIYGTPGESLVATQPIQFKKKYGIITGVSDREYVTNSFHCHVAADITPIQKQDIEYPMFHLCNGGNIGYARMRCNYNLKAYKDLTRRAMKMGFYWGNNSSTRFCEHCGKSFIDADTCPYCGSDDLTVITRMSGYLSYERIRGKTMYSDTKLAEFRDRVSM